MSGDTTAQRVRIYDTTLRDGTQGEGFQLSVAEKIRVAHILDELGVAYIEGGWPGSNPRDIAFFDQVKGESFANTRIAAFGSTRRAQHSCEKDDNLQKLLEASVPVVTIFGKSWSFQATEVLGITREQNLEIIVDSVRYLSERVDEVIFDAEHFFDGAAEDEEYAFAALKAAVEGGASCLTLCDTNGGTLPERVSELTAKAVRAFGIPVGIHTHNDAELAVANSLAAVRAGANLVQGTINGYGERCGNANLVAIIPSLELKMGVSCIGADKLQSLTRVAHTIDEISNNVPISRQAYVGRSAFAHKGGVHVNAVMKVASSYEHIEPEAVGNHRRVLVSDLSGRSNLAYKAEELGVELDPKHPSTIAVLERIKELENRGYQFEDAEASLSLLLAEARDERRQYFEVEEADVTTILVDAHEPNKISNVRTRAVVKLRFDAEYAEPIIAHGCGPVDALGTALHILLARAYPEVDTVRLVDYRVRIMDSSDGIAAAVRVLIRASDGKDTWGTVGVSTNVVEASWFAMVDAYEYKLSRSNVKSLLRDAAE